MIGNIMAHKFYIKAPNAPKAKPLPVSEEAKANKRKTRDKIYDLTESKFKEVWE